MADAPTIPDTLPTGFPDLGSGTVAPVDPVAQAMAQVATQIDALSDQGKQAMVQIYTQGYNAAWKMGVGLTPKQFFSALGVKGAAFLIRGGALRAFLTAQYPDLATGLLGLPTNYSVSIGNDGTVTITEN